MRFLRRWVSVLARLRSRCLAHFGARNQTLVGGVEKQGEKLLCQIKAVVNQRHQETVGEIILKGVAADRATMTVGLGAHGFEFALLFKVEKSECKLRKQVFKGMKVHTRESKKLLGIA